MPDHSPAECVRILIDLIKRKQFGTIEFWKHLAHVLAYGLDLIDNSQPDVIGTDARATAYANAMADLSETLQAEGQVAPVAAASAPLGNWLVKAVINQLVQYLIEQLESGNLQEWLKDLLEKLTG